MGDTVHIFAQLVGNARQQLEVPHAGCTVEELRVLVGRAFNRPQYTLKLVHKGMALPEDGKAVVRLSEGDIVLAMPYRTAPPARIVSAAIGARSGSTSQQQEDDEEPDEAARLPAGAPRWEVAAVESLRSRGCPEWVMEWVILIRPMRLLVLLLFLIGCVIASKLSLGPVFILGAIIWCIFTNLGRKRDGDVSAYSIFNAGVQRLPGQLDADHLDQQLRRGQLG